MQKRNLVGLVLSTTLGLGLLAGCSLPSLTGTGQAGINTNTGSDANGTPSSDLPVIGNSNPGPVNASGALNASQAGVTAADAADVQATEQEMEGYSAATADADPLGASPYGVLSAPIAATGTVSVNAGKANAMTPAQRKSWLTRRQQTLVRAEKNLRANEKTQIQKLAAKTPWVKDDGGVTETRQASLTLTRTDKNGKTYTRTLTILRTINIAGSELVHAHNTISETFPAGGTHSVNWEKTLNSDGGYAIVFNQDRHYENGPERKADWSKAIDADGHESGTGTITWFNKNGVQVAQETITFGGDDVSGATVAPTGIATGTLPAVTDTVDGTTSPGATASGTAQVGVAASASATVSAN
jgi:hypothetical protein